MDDYKENLTYGATPLIFARANELKLVVTEFEKILWKHLRNRRLNGYKFRRQHPVGQFIADFYCHQAKLVVEVDGDIHDTIEVQQRDEGRTYMMEALDLTVIRFTNNDVKLKLQETLYKISSYLSSGALPSP